MKLLSPVSSLSSAAAQIKAGSDEIYVGLKTDIYKRYSFSGRGQCSKSYRSIVANENELKDIVNLAHDSGVDVSFVANTPIFSDLLDENNWHSKEFMQHIDFAIQCQVDNIIVGDIGLLCKVGQTNPPAKLHASTFLDTMNIEQLMLLKDLGATRSILTYQVSLQEIELLCRSAIMEIEVFGYLGCSFFNGACNLMHEMGEVTKDEDILIGVPCKAEYKVWGDGTEEELTPFFDAELGCALCSLFTLNKIGVDVIKIAGRDRDYEKIAKVTKLFKSAIGLAKTSYTENNYLSNLGKFIPEGWKRVWCSGKRCKYRKNAITDSYIGAQ